MNMISTSQFKSLDDIFSYYNKRLFNDELPKCLINMSRVSGSYGFYSPKRWKEANKEDNLIDEISLNPDHMNRPDKDWHSTLVHEMCHLWQQAFGKPSRANYHNKQFSAKMEEIGLITTSTGFEGGARTGQSITHYVKQGGAFEKLIENKSYKERLFFLPNKRSVNSTVTGKPQEQNKIEDQEEEEEPKKKSKIKYTCVCGFNLWGKPNLSFKCNQCNEDFSDSQNP